MMHSMTMNNANSAFGFSALWGVHVLSVVLFFVGVALLVLWAARTLNHSQLKLWGISLAVLGTVACLLTLNVRGAAWGGNNNSCMKDGVCTMGMNGCMKDGKCMMDMDSKTPSGGMMGGGQHMMPDGTMMDNGGMMNMGDDMMDMSMDDMASMLEGKTGDAFDKAFIEGMIPHHQGAIDMARAALQSAKHDEIKRMARDIISAQQSEIDMMKQWQKDWGYNQ